MFITFEGIDSSGKSTQCKLVADWLRLEGRTVQVVREPGGTVISEKIRDILLHTDHGMMDGVAELYLFSAARAQLVKERIQPALDIASVVIADRFYDSTTAYQGYGRGIDLETVRRINDLSSHELTPDLTFFLDIRYEESVRRREALNTGHDRIEQLDREFFELVRNGYLELATNEQDRFRVIDGTRDIETITAEIIAIMRDWMNRYG